MRKSVIGAAMLCWGASAAAQSMPLPTFVARATALEKKGAMALFHRGEIRALQTEMKGATEALKAERQAAEKAGRPPAYCPPRGQASVRMDARQMIAELRAIPAAEARTMTTTDGVRAMLRRRFPC